MHERNAARMRTPKPTEAQASRSSTTPDQRLVVLAQASDLQLLVPFVLARLVRVWVLGALLGSFFAVNLSRSTSFFVPVAFLVFGFGNSLVVLWLPVEAMLILATRRSSRFDQRVQRAIHRKSKPRRSVPISIGIVGIASLVLAVTSLMHTWHASVEVLAHATAGVALIVLAWILTWRLTRPMDRVDWSQSQLCRQCGYDRGQGVFTCPECGEEATDD